MTPLPLVRIAVVAAVCAAAAAVPAAAQPPAFADVAPRLEDGAPVRLLIDGARVDGWVSRAAPDRLVIRRGAAGGLYDVPLGRLEQISYDDGAANGALIGAVVGAVPGVCAGLLVRMLCESEAGSCDPAPFVMGGFTAAVGLAIGVGIDEAIRTTVRFAPPRTTARVSVVPDPRRPAARLSIRF
jgi:hypothetical protein